MLLGAALAGVCGLGETGPATNGADPEGETSSTAAATSQEPTGTGAGTASIPTEASAETTDPAPEQTPTPDGAPGLTTTAVPTTTVPPSKKWTLLAGGDVLMDRSEPQGIDPFEFIEPPLASADIAVVNSEMVISDRGTPLDKDYVFRAPPSAALRMAAAGIDVASLANNHAKDFGPTALVDTIGLLEEAGVVALGAGATDSEAYRYRILEVGTKATVAFVGVSMVVPWGFPAGPDTPGIASARPPSRILESVREASAVADVVIALVHWGIERSTCPNAHQEEFAQDLFDAGADAVIGHHPHVLQPVEFADGRLVAYSLGNFIWHARWGITGDTGVLQIDFDGGEIVGWSFHPHLLDDNGAPRPVSEGSRFERINDIITGDCARHQPPPPTTTTTTPSGAEESETTEEASDTATTTTTTSVVIEETDTTEGPSEEDGE